MFHPEPSVQWSSLKPLINKYGFLRPKAGSTLQEKQMVAELALVLGEADQKLKKMFMYEYGGSLSASASEDKKAERAIELMMHRREFDRRLRESAELKRLAGKLIQELVDRTDSLAGDWTGQDSVAKLREDIDKGVARLEKERTRKEELQKQVDDLQEELARRDVEREAFLKAVGLSEELEAGDSDADTEE